jgi:hypothetical protein
MFRLDHADFFKKSSVQVLNNPFLFCFSFYKRLHKKIKICDLKEKENHFIPDMRENLIKKR